MVVLAQKTSTEDWTILRAMFLVAWTVVRARAVGLGSDSRLACDVTAEACSNVTVCGAATALHANLCTVLISREAALLPRVP
jgi:hypothetical protein